MQGGRPRCSESATAIDDNEAEEHLDKQKLRHLMTEVITSYYANINLFFEKVYAAIIFLSNKKNLFFYNQCNKIRT